MSIPEILEELKTLKEGMSKILKSIELLQQHNEQNMERHSAVIIAGVKTIKEEKKSIESIVSTSFYNTFERRGDLSPKTIERRKNQPNEKFGIEDLV